MEQPPQNSATEPRKWLLLESTGVYLELVDNGVVNGGKREDEENFNHRARGATETEKFASEIPAMKCTTSTFI